ncbi:MAG: multicopper oxidase family protein [Vicinamibacterales bacterium]
MSRSMRLRAVLLAGALAAAPQGTFAQSTLQPTGWDAGIRLVEATDHNPDPHIVEVDIDARVARVQLSADTSVEAWTYNGSIPGPLIRTKVGDRLILHFTNRLPQPTTIHWHGLRVPIAMDGVPGISQPETGTGESFTYDFVVRDAGTFWYHPHVMSAAQVGFGLYGALLVDNPAERVGTSDELTLVLSDIALTSNGTMEPPDSGGPAGMVFGREGNHVLVNGREKPRITARAGALQRWRIVNAAKSRYFELSLADHSLRVIGSDGGLLEYPVTRETVVLAPGERADLLVAPTGKPGTELTMQSLLYNRGYGSVETRPPFDDLFSIALTGEPALPAAPPADIARDESIRSRRWARHRLLSRSRCRRRLTVRSRTGSTVSPFLRGSRSAPIRATRRCGRSRTRPSGRTRSICTASSSRCSTRTGRRCVRSSGRTPSTYRSRRPSASSCATTIGKGAGCSTATCWTTPTAG